MEQSTITTCPLTIPRFLEAALPPRQEDYLALPPLNERENLRAHSMMIKPLLGSKSPGCKEESKRASWPITPAPSILAMPGGDMGGAQRHLLGSYRLLQCAACSFHYTDSEPSVPHSHLQSPGALDRCHLQRNRRSCSDMTYRARERGVLYSGVKGRTPHHRQHLAFLMVPEAQLLQWEEGTNGVFPQSTN